MKTIIFPLFLLTMTQTLMAQTPIACLVEKFDSDPIYISQNYRHYMSLIKSKETCTHQEDNTVFKRDYYVSKDRSTICEKEYDKQYRRTRYYCTTVIKFENGKTSLANLKDHDCNGSAYNMVLKVKDYCPM